MCLVLPKVLCDCYGEGAIYVLLSWARTCLGLHRHLSRDGRPAEPLANCATY